MDGYTLRTQVANTLGESRTSSFLDERTTFDYLYEAAVEFCRITQILGTVQTITTTASTSGYLLNPDFLNLRVMNDTNEWVIKYYTGSATSFIPHRIYEAAYYSNNTTATAIPDSFAITGYDTAIANMTGTASATGAVASDESTLTTTGSFANASVGDTIHNTSDGSHGIVTYKTSSTSLQTHLWYGTNNYWTSGNAYIVVPQGRKQLVVNPPSKTAAHTITIPYIQKPTPVYSDYRFYPFDPVYGPALVKYAAWLYKYRDSEPNFGDAWFKYFIAQAGRGAKDTNKSFDRTRFKVNLRKRTFGDRSYR